MIGWRLRASGFLSVNARANFVRSHVHGCQFFPRKGVLKMVAKITPASVVDAVVAKLDGLQLGAFDVGIEIATTKKFSLLEFQSANATLRLMFYVPEGLCYLAVVHVKFKPIATLDRWQTMQWADEELEQLFVCSRIRTVDTDNRHVYLEDYFRSEIDILAAS
jgi:hypothetical protein